MNTAYFILLSTQIVVLVILLFEYICGHRNAPTIPNPPAPPEHAPKSETSSVPSDYHWMVATFPIGARVDYLNIVLLIGRHDYDDGFSSSLCEYVDDHGRIREVTISVDQLRAIAKRDEPKPL